MNGTIALLIIVYILRNNDLYTLFFSLFFYLTLHYSYSAITIFCPEMLTSLRGSTQLGAKLTGIGFLLFIIIILIWRYKKLLVEQVGSGPSKLLGFSCLLWFLAMVIYWIIKGLNNTFPTPLAIQNIFSACFFCIIFIGFGVVLSRESYITKRQLKKFCNIIAILISLILLIATYEMITLHAWCGAYYSDSMDIVYRASSILFNPNLLGLWCALVILFAGYVYHMKSVPRKLPIFIIILCSLAMFLSGSRSGLLICFLPFSLITVLLVFQKENRLEYKDIFLPFGIFFVFLLSLIIFVKIGIPLMNSESEWVNALLLIADRFILMPVEIISFASDILLNYDGPFSEVIKSIIEMLPLYLSKSSAISIHGRFSTGLIDNGYLVMLEDTGWAGLIIWVFMLVYLIYLGVKVLRIAPGIRSVYALSIIIGCAFSAMFMRSFQVFPFWVMIAMALGLSLSWFQRLLTDNSLYRQSLESD